MNRNGHRITLELDPATNQSLEHLARAWGVSRQEAIRRVVEQADPVTDSGKKQDRLKAFKELQRRLHLTSAKATEWQNAVREARR